MLHSTECDGHLQYFWPAARLALRSPALLPLRFESR
jgi:hypothetical protein